eukprot:2319961-Rhodomonas_salina.1
MYGKGSMCSSGQRRGTFPRVTTGRVTLGHVCTLLGHMVSADLRHMWYAALGHVTSVAGSRHVMYSAGSRGRDLVEEGRNAGAHRCQTRPS